MEKNQSVPYIVYDQDGTIVRWGHCIKSMVESQASRPGETAIESDAMGHNDYVVQGKVNKFTSTEKTARENMAAGWVWKMPERMAVDVQTVDQIARQVREQRDGLLSKYDWVTIRATDNNERVPAAWVKYRTDLRNITKQPGFPKTIIWPIEPAE